MEVKDLLYFFFEVARLDVVVDFRRRVVPFFPVLELLRFFEVPELLFFFAAPFLPPPVSLFTVAQARRSASPVLRPRRLYPLSMCSAWRFCFEV
jgi:hypothetical protein